jgi:hypothetical protein
VSTTSKKQCLRLYGLWKTDNPKNLIFFKDFFRRNRVHSKLKSGLGKLMGKSLELAQKSNKLYGADIYELIEEYEEDIFSITIILYKIVLLQ